MHLRVSMPARGPVWSMAMIVPDEQIGQGTNEWPSGPSFKSGRWFVG